MKLLFSSDWHLRNDKPISRIDDFQQVQKDTLIQIAKICKQNNAELIIAGDIFDKPKDNIQELVNQVYEIFKDINIYFICGQHDLLFHSLDNFEKGNIGIINNFENWNHSEEIINSESIIWKFDYGKEIIDIDDYDNLIKICVWHKYCEKEQLPFYIKNGISAKDLIDNYNYNIYICGDNHKSFIYEKDNKIVFNMGCITRQSITEKNYNPSVILFDTEKRDYEQIFLCDNNLNVFIDSVISKEQLEREQRINSFISLVESKESISFDFITDIKNYCLKNKVKDEIIKEIDNILLEVNE